MKRFWFPQYQKPILLLQNYLPMSKIIFKVGCNTPVQVDDWLVSYFYYWLPLISGMCSQGREMDFSCSTLPSRPEILWARLSPTPLIIPSCPKPSLIYCVRPPLTDTALPTSTAAFVKEDFGLLRRFCSFSAFVKGRGEVGELTLCLRPWKLFFSKHSLTKRRAEHLNVKVFFHWYSVLYFLKWLGSKWMAQFSMQKSRSRKLATVCGICVCVYTLPAWSRGKVENIQ